MSLKQKLALAAGIVVLAIVAYANAVSNGFALDDTGVIVVNPMVRDLGNIGHVLRTDYWNRGIVGISIVDPGLYRPLTVFTYMLDYHFWQLDAAPYHVVNIVLHAVTSALLFLLAVELLPSAFAAFAAAAIFAVHPIHTEAVTGIVGRAEVLASMFFIAAFWIGRKREASIPRAVTMAVLFFLGLLSKETAVTLPAVLAVDDWLHRDEFGAERNKTIALRYGLLAAVAIVYFAMRFNAVSGHGVWVGFLNVSAGARMLTASRVLLEYIVLFVFPRTLLADYWLPDVPTGSAGMPLALVSIVAWIALIAAFVFTKARKSPTLILGTAWFFITILPVSNLLFATGFGKAERILYLPSAGLCLVVGWFCAQALARASIRPFVPVAVAAGVLALGVRTYKRNPDWKDTPTLAQATLQHSPRSPLMNDLAGAALVTRGDVAQAIPYFQTAVRETPQVPLLHSHLGAAYLAQRKYDASAAEYQEAVRLDPTVAAAHGDLGLAYFNMGRADDAIREFQAAARITPDSATPHIDLGAVYQAQNRLDLAELQFREAIRLDPANVAAKINVGSLYVRQKRYDEAIRQLMQALGMDPRSPEAHNALGYALFNTGHKLEAIEQYRLALQYRPNYPLAKANLDDALKSR